MLKQWARVPDKERRNGPETANRRKRRGAKLRALPASGRQVAELPKADPRPRGLVLGPR